MQRLVCQQTQLELDALRDGKPVEAISQQVLDVVVLLAPTRQIRRNQVDTIFQKPLWSWIKTGLLS